MLLFIAHTRVRSCATKSELFSSRMISPTEEHCIVLPANSHAASYTKRDNPNRIT